MMTRQPGLKGTLIHYWHLVIKEAAKFGVVGLIAFVVDMGSWNLLVHGMPGPTQGPLDIHPTRASILASLIATVVSWVGNRYWTFRDKRSRERGKELLQFLFFNAIALVITAASLYVSRWVLGLNTLFWDNAARFIGIGLGTLFRFWTYRRFVFTAELDEEYGEHDELVDEDAPRH